MTTRKQWRDAKSRARWAAFSLDEVSVIYRALGLLSEYTDELEVETLFLESEEVRAIMQDLKPLYKCTNCRCPRGCSCCTEEWCWCMNPEGPTCPVCTTRHHPWCIEPGRMESPGIGEIG